MDGNEIVVLDPERSQANQLGPAPAQPPVTTVPPLRLRRCLNDREGQMGQTKIRQTAKGMPKAQSLTMTKCPSRIRPVPFRGQ